MKNRTVHLEHEFHCQWQCVHCNAQNEETGYIKIEIPIQKKHGQDEYLAELNAKEKAAISLSEAGKALLREINDNRNYIYIASGGPTIFRDYSISNLFIKCPECGGKKLWYLPKSLRWVSIIFEKLSKAISIIGISTINGGIYLLPVSLIACILAFVPFSLAFIVLLIWQSIAKLRLAKASSPLCQPNIIIENLPELQQKQPDPKLTDTNISRHRTFIEHDSSTWKCAECGTENPNSRGSCANCGKYK